MAKLDVNALPARQWEKKTFSCDIADGQKFEFTVRQTTAIDALDMQGASDRAKELLGDGMVVDGEAVVLKNNSAQILVTVFDNQTGSPEDRYSLDELVVAMVRIPQLSPVIVEAFTWILEGVSSESPPG